MRSNKKKQSNEYGDPSQQIFTRDARAIFQEENSRGRRSYGNLNERIQMEGEVARYLCLDILGLRLELDKAVR